MYKVAVILGSESDAEVVRDSKMLEVLKEVGIPYQVSIISSHRNPQELAKYCAEAVQGGIKVFIAVAGMAAALPGVIASYILSETPDSCERVVIGVPLISDIPGGLDALLSMVRLPSGIPVAVSGIGKAGLHNAAILACQILAQGDSEIQNALCATVLRHKKYPKIGIEIIEI